MPEIHFEAGHAAGHLRGLAASLASPCPPSAAEAAAAVREIAERLALATERTAATPATSCADIGALR